MVTRSVQILHEDVDVRKDVTLYVGDTLKVIGSIYDNYYSGMYGSDLGSYPNVPDPSDELPPGLIYNYLKRYSILLAYYATFTGTGVMTTVGEYRIRQGYIFSDGDTLSHYVGDCIYVHVLPYPKTARIKISNSYKVGTPFVKVDENYKKGILYTRVNGHYKKGV